MPKLNEMLADLEESVEPLEELTSYGEALKKAKSKRPDAPAYVHQAWAAFSGGVPVAQKPGATQRDKFKMMLLFYKPLTKEAMKALQQEVNDVKAVLMGMEGDLSQGKAIVTTEGYEAVARAAAELKKIQRQLYDLSRKTRLEVKKGSRG